MALSGAVALPAVAVLVDRDPRLRRLRWSSTATAAARETAIVLALFALWQLAARGALRQVEGAFTHAQQIIDVQRRLHLPSEITVQQLALPYESLIRASNGFYLYAHLNGMVVFLAWMFLRHRADYPRARNLVVLLTGACLLVQMVPVAPPRMLDELGFVDTALRYGQSVYGPFGSGLANQLSAMPSVHVGWAVLIAFMVVTVSRSRWRWLVLAHPVLTMLVVVVTANHFWLDGIVAAGLLAVAVVVERPLRDRLQRAGRSAAGTDRTHRTHALTH